MHPTSHHHHDHGGAAVASHHHSTHHQPSTQPHQQPQHQRQPTQTSQSSQPQAQSQQQQQQQAEQRTLARYHQLPSTIEYDGGGCEIDLGTAINAISASPNGRLIMVAGRDVLKVITLEERAAGEASWNMVKNLRVGRTNLTFSSVDVQWNPHVENRDTVATAATNGAIIIWNITRDSKSQQEKILTDHKRTVNSLSWSPFTGNYLLSGSTDSTIKLWDLRDTTKHVTFATAKSGTDSVREVQFSPLNANQFASALDSGTIQLWDPRNAGRGPLQQLTSAHQGLVLTIAWHPEDKNILASGGRDRFIKTWDLLDAETAQSPVSLIQTAEAVGKIRWRPGYSSQIASSFSLMDPNIHIWDFTTPYIPIYSLTKHNDVATGLVWHQASPNHLISCSKDGFLRLSHVPLEAYHPYHHIRTTAVAFDGSGNLAIVNDVIDRHKYDNLLPPAKEPVKPATVDKTRTPKPSAFSSLFPFNQSQPAAPRSISPPSQTRATIGTSNGSTRRGLMSIYSARSLPVDSDFGFDQSTFAVLANSYCFTINERYPTIALLCDHNSQVAQQAHQHHISLLWSLLKQAYCFDDNDLETELLPQPSMNEPGAQPLTIGASRRSVHSTVGHRTRSVRDNPFDDYSTPRSNAMLDYDSVSVVSAETDEYDHLGFHEASHHGVSFDCSEDLMATPDVIRSGDTLLAAEAIMPLIPLPSDVEGLFNGAHDGLTPPMSDASSDSMDEYIPALHSLVPQWNIDSTIQETLQFHADHGDVQTCVTVLLVMGSKISVDAQMKTLWFLSYIDLLRRFQLWTTVNEIVCQTDIPAIRSINQKSTVIHKSCPKCNKPLLTNSYSCEHCKSITNTCSICHQVVRGLYAWCQGCGHGGHAHHLQQWFMHQRLCPTGCKHACTFSSHASF